MAGVTIEIPVRWGDMDALGHVNNTVLFRYCESARIAYFEAADFASFAERPTEGPGLVQADLSFKKQLKYPATVRVVARCTRIGNRSFTLTYELQNQADGSLVASGSSVAVWVDYAASAALPIPEAMKAAIAAIEERPLAELTGA